MRPPVRGQVEPMGRRADLQSVCLERHARDLPDLRPEPLRRTGATHRTGPCAPLRRQWPGDPPVPGLWPNGRGGQAQRGTRPRRPSEPARRRPPPRGRELFWASCATDGLRKARGDMARHIAVYAGFFRTGDGTRWSGRLSQAALLRTFGAERLRHRIQAVRFVARHLRLPWDESTAEAVIEPAVSS